MNPNSLIEQMAETKKRTVLITGSSTGFGRRATTLFLEQGWRVIATLRNSEDRIQIFQEELQKYGEQIQICSLDVTSSEEIQKISVFIQNKFKNQLDCLINNAGYAQVGALEDLSEEQIRKQMEVNFFGTVLTTQALVPALIKTKGKIIFISSVLGITGMPLVSLYCASKYAVEGFAESLYHELKPFKVPVSIVEPGRFLTEFGSNILWGMRSFSQTSPYKESTENYKKFKESLSHAPHIPNAIQMAKTLVDLAEMKKMPLRVRCGKDVQATFWLKRLLPEWMITRIFSIAFQKKYYTLNEDK